MRKVPDNPRLRLRAGQVVEVRSADEILATLDENSRLDGLPFMPEMLQFCGKRFRVYKTAHKTCDTIQDYVIRRMDRTVHLQELRCSGEDHGGCQAGCLLFWKEAWLKPASIPEPSPAEQGFQKAFSSHDQDVHTLYKACQTTSATGASVYRCQTTEILNATHKVRLRERFNPFFYIRDLTSGNVGLWDFIRYGALAVVNNCVQILLGKRYPHICGLAGDKTPHASLNLQPGELVRIKPKDEIFETLNNNQRNRGLFFDVEMIPYCNREGFKVLRRVDKIINEKTGEMMHLQNPCIILDGVTCSGKLSLDRMFCPRSVYPYWREIWLERVGDEKNTSK